MLWKLPKRTPSCIAWGETSQDGVKLSFYVLFLLENVFRPFDVSTFPPKLRNVQCNVDASEQTNKQTNRQMKAKANKQTERNNQLGSFSLIFISKHVLQANAVERFFSTWGHQPTRCFAPHVAFALEGTFKIYIINNLQLVKPRS